MPRLPTQEVRIVRATQAQEGGTRTRSRGVAERPGQTRRAGSQVTIGACHLFLFFASRWQSRLSFYDHASTRKGKFVRASTGRFSLDGP